MWYRIGNIVLFYIILYIFFFLIDIYKFVVYGVDFIWKIILRYEINVKIYELIY